jgi:ABC-2 type transport system permease protein
VTARRMVGADALLVARREYLDRIRSRAFRISTLVVGLVAVAMALTPIAIKYLDQHAIVRIAVIAPTAALADGTVSIVDGLVNRPPPGQDPDRWEKPFRIATSSDLPAALDDVAAGRLDGVLDVSRRADGGLSFVFHSRDTATSARAQIIGFAAEGVAILDWTASVPRGPDTPPFRQPSFDVQTEGAAATPAGELIDQQELAGRSILATIFIVLLFISLVTYGMWVATSVATEKTSRVMELLISATRPRNLLLGKVIGVGAAGLTQCLAIVLPSLAVFLLQDRIAALVLDPSVGPGAPIVSVTPGMLLAYGAFFLLALILYTLAYAAAGSLVSRQEDVQQLAMPMSFLTMAGYLLAIFALGSITARWVVALSFVPFFSPFLMVTRIMVGRAEPWEVALSLGLLVATIGAVAILAERVYGAGVLLYGQRPGLRLFLAAMRRR